MFGRTTLEAVWHRYADIVKPGVRFVQATILAIDPAARRVETDAGSFDGDILVVALGADLDPAATPGLLEGGHEFYTVDGAIAAARRAAPGSRAAAWWSASPRTPFKCPPAPSETALLVHDHLTARGLRDRSTIAWSCRCPCRSRRRRRPPRPCSRPSPSGASSGVPGALVTGLDAERKVALIADGREIPYDLFLGVPAHHVPAVVAESG